MCIFFLIVNQSYVLDCESVARCELSANVHGSEFVWCLFISAPSFSLNVSKTLKAYSQISNRGRSQKFQSL